MNITMLKVQKGIKNRQASILVIISQCAAVVGGAICGYYSQFFGRRLTIVMAVTFGLCMITLWTTPTTFPPLAGSVFFLQMANKRSLGRHANFAERIYASAI